ncbi:MAG: RluA family pseudouridine synthase [Pirellulales bacterium]
MKTDGSQVFHVQPEEAGQTLPSLLRRRLPELSWNQARKLITGRRVQVHGNLCLDHGRRLQEGEVVKVLAHALPTPPRDDDVRIRYVDAHVVVVEKPAGMTTLRHSEERNWPARRKQHQPTLDEVVSRLLAVRASSAHGRQSPQDRPGRNAPQDARRRPGDPPPKTLPVRPVHRLDRETSGLMVFARTVPAERVLVQQFRRHSIHRAYIAIAHGAVDAQTIESQLVRDRGDGRRGSSKLPKAGKRAVTHVRPLERLHGYTVVACRLETGRTHQIRIHLSENGHFVCGDKVYCQPLFQKPLVDRSGAPRLALHAAELGFIHPLTGKPLDFTMPLPPDLQQLLDRLRKAAGATATGSPVVPREGWPELAEGGDDESDEDEDFLPSLPPPEAYEERPARRDERRSRPSPRPGSRPEKKRGGSGKKPGGAAPPRDSKPGTPRPQKDGRRGRSRRER